MADEKPAVPGVTPPVAPVAPVASAAPVTPTAPLPNEAELQSLRDTLNKMTIRHGENSTLVVVKDGQPVPVEQLTVEQRKALAWFEQAHFPKKPATV